MLSKTILEEVLDYRHEDNMPISNLIKSVKFVWYLNRQNPILEKILDVKIKELDLPIFFKELDKLAIKHKKNRLNSLKKKGTGLNPYPLTWIYYALFFSLNLEENEVTHFLNNTRIIKISEAILKFHYSYLKYIYEHEKEKITIKKSMLQLSARTLVRTIEYLIKFEQSNNEYLSEKYFNCIEVDINFLELASSENSTEKDYFLIKSDTHNKNNFFVYENTARDIIVQVESSKAINKGDQSENFEQNHRISDYFAKGFDAYLKVLDIDITKYKSKDTNSSYSRERGEMQYTEEEELLENSYPVQGSTPIVLSHEDIHTVKSKLKVKTRFLPLNDLEKSIPNLYKQKMRNKAFSASVSKKSMMLSTDYKIPPIQIFRDFLKYFFDKQLEADISLKDTYRVIFMMDSISGLGYKSIIELILEKNHIVKLENNIISIALNKKLFAKNKNEYISNSSYRIKYKLPENLIYLINRIKSYYRELDEEKINLLLTDEESKKYFSYIKYKIKSYPKRVTFDPKSMWRIIDSYRKSLYREDMSTLFCMARNQQNDTPKLAYTSTNSRAQRHSIFLEKLYIDLGLHELSAYLLDFKTELFRPKVEFNNSKSYVGSSQAVNQEKSRTFFSKLRSLINQTTNEERYFNLVSIYTRYALSLLVGTRNYKESASIAHCSTELHLLTVSEKADTLLSGIRVVPLCNEIETLIVQYKGLCKSEAIMSDNIYLKHKSKIKLYTRGIAIEILNNYESDNDLIDFITFVPLNTGRHVVTKVAIEQNFNLHYLEAYLGHYMAGEEHQGIYSTLDMPSYISNFRTLTSGIARTYGVLPL